MNIQDWCPLGWTGWISLQSKGLSRVFSSTTVRKLNFFGLNLVYGPTLCDPMNHSTPGLPVHHQLPESTQTHVHWVDNAIQPSLPLSPPPPPPIFPSIRVFSRESALHIRWPKYWSFSVGPSNEYSGLMSFRIDWFDLLAVQGTLKSLLQYHSSKASILQCPALWCNSHIHIWLLGKP